MSIKRKLYADEINFILDFIQPNKNIPRDTAKSIVKITKNKLYKMLSTQLVYPEIIPELKEQLHRYYIKSLIQPGETVGVLCAQSIGEKQTQTTLNTFHKAGQSEKTMTKGVPRFQELINATKNQVNINHKIYLKNGKCSIKTARKIIGTNVLGIKLSDLILDIEFHLNGKTEHWYDSFRDLYDNFDNRIPCVTLKINLNKIFHVKLDFETICDRIQEYYEDLKCVFSPYEQGIIDVFVNTSEIDIPFGQNKIKEEDISLYYIEEIVVPNLEKLKICGIPCIEDIFFIKEKGEWIVETNATQRDTNTYSFLDILCLPNIDYTRTLSNNIWDIYETLDIEAVKQYLIEEFMNVMDGINLCHTKILVDRMTHGGTISSITRYTLKKEESGPLGKASFEETMDNFLNAGVTCDKENVKGVSASIICGKQINTGTGMVSVSLDIDFLEKKHIS